ncbi:hypothetical protein R75461_07275 [Paraburkholderia nemoris]|uniref:hypothetical protein n=1 Tax=Paraburkholderia nemoris TaxID=2793076 RepID=UPI00190B63E9|nr:MULTISPECIES: hypothetical protein [Paraburkholderia]MBK3786071.1 hypothetical protein [Paraburkholderia aspalathi]CAE6846648.1 hypothetical protein R75461_07275 [Paraburkholderia nemoris]
MYFTFRELAAVALTGGTNYFVDLRKEAGKWLIEVSVLDAGKKVQQKYLVQTNRGKTKTWKYLDDALAFVNEYCANCQNLSIAVDGKVWKLRSEEREAGTQQS